jgi:hypothetical protein
VGCRSLGSSGRHHLLSAAAPIVVTYSIRRIGLKQAKVHHDESGSSSCTCDAVSCTAASSAAGVLKRPSAARCATSSKATLPSSVASPTCTCK